MEARPDLRIGDAERDVTTRHLRESFAQGRLSMDEFNERLSTALNATTQAQLNDLTKDLPLTGSSHPLPSSPAAGPYPKRPYQPQSYQQGYGGWQGGGPGSGSDGSGPRAGGRIFPVLVGLMALWLVISTVIMPLRMFPLPGRMAMFLIVFGIVRGILRKLWRR
jgi:Domain of unknown function (DUF1707)